MIQSLRLIIPSLLWLFALCSPYVKADDTDNTLGKMIYTTAGVAISNGVALNLGAELNVPATEQLTLGIGAQKESINGILTSYAVTRFGEKSRGGWFSGLRGQMVGKIGVAHAQGDNAPYIALGAGLGNGDKDAFFVELTLDRKFGQIDRTALMLNFVFSLHALSELYN